MPADIKAAKNKELETLKEEQAKAQALDRKKKTAQKPIYKQIKFVGMSWRLCTIQTVCLFILSCDVETQKVQRKIKSLQSAISGTYTDDNKTSEMRKELEKYQDYLIYIQVCCLSRFCWFYICRSSRMM